MNNASLVIRRISSLGLRALSSQTCFSTACPILIRSGWTSNPSRPPLTRQLCSIQHGNSNQKRRTSLCGQGHTNSGTQKLGRRNSSTRKPKTNPKRPSITVAPKKLEEPTLPAISEAAYNSHPDRLRNIDYKQIGKMFGRDVALLMGPELLHAIQKQRITGTLDLTLNVPVPDPSYIDKALFWLRKTHPLDEDAAIMRRIKLEDQAAEAALIQMSEDLGIYTPQSPSTTSVSTTAQTTTSILDRVRAEKEAALDKKLADQAAAAAASQADEIRTAASDSGLIQHPARRAVLQRRTESADWVKKYREKARLSSSLEPPSMTKTQRLLPSTLFGLAVITLCILFAQNYVAPMREARMFPDIKPAAATVIGLIALNSVVLVLWRLPPMWRFMNTYFLMVPAMPRAVSLLANCFSHQAPLHFAGNMLVLWMAGPSLHDSVGRGNFLALYLCSGVFASYLSLARFVFANNLITTSLGASGALCGMLAAWCSIHAGQTFKFLILPEGWGPFMSTTTLLVFFIGLEVVGILRGYMRVDHWAHLGGYVTGLGTAWVWKDRARRRKEEREREEEEKGTGMKFLERVGGKVGRDGSVR